MTTDDFVKVSSAHAHTVVRFACYDCGTESIGVHCDRQNGGQCGTNLGVCDGCGEVYNLAPAGHPLIRAGYRIAPSPDPVARKVARLPPLD